MDHGQKKQRRKRRAFTLEFKAEAVRLCRVGDRSITQVAAELDLPGHEAAIDFTDCSSLRVSIAGQFFAHLLFRFILSFSKWRFVALAFSETFAALVAGL